MEYGFLAEGIEDRGWKRRQDQCARADVDAMEATDGEEAVPSVAQKL